ncbi:MAG: NlpC/P60 family protein [Sedimenticola sp.]|nr:NlpC/P60 family protein [Sedimenticola sp.]
MGAITDRSRQIRRLTALSILPVVLLLSACGSLPPTPQEAGVSMESPLPPAEREAVLARLYRQHQEWQGTPYRIGGQSRQGVDCSGFVQLTYRQRLGLDLPRTTERQATKGAPVERHQLSSGDLVFFLIDGRTRHVGIYLDRQQFLHASKSQGVIISDLDNPYWQAAYWRARRVL